VRSRSTRRSVPAREYVVVATRGRAAITVGSDHTDRKVESISIELSKRVCPNVMARPAWDYAEVADHVDDLVLRAWVRENRRWHLYQEAPVGTLLPPAYWLARLEASLRGPGAVVLFSGTVPTVGGVLRYGDGFRVSLEDPRRRRTITARVRGDACGESPREIGGLALAHHAFITGSVVTAV
jgi:hypothetical protein